MISDCAGGKVGRWRLNPGLPPIRSFVLNDLLRRFKGWDNLPSGHGECNLSFGGASCV
jgi:hypothetical protein